MRGDGLQLCRVCASPDGEYGILRFPAMENDGPAARDLRNKMISFMVGSPGDSVEDRNVLGSALVVVSIRYSKDAEAVTSWLKLTESFQDSSPVLQMLHESIMETKKCIGIFEERFNCTIPLLEFGKSYPPLFFSRLEACGYRHMYAFSFRTGVMHHFQVEIELNLKKKDGAALQQFAQHGDFEEVDHHREEQERDDRKRQEQREKGEQSDEVWNRFFHTPNHSSLEDALAPLPQVDDHHKAQIDAQTGAQIGEARGNAKDFMDTFMDMKNSEHLAYQEDIRYGEYMVTEEVRRKVAAEEVRRKVAAQYPPQGSLADY